MTILERPEICVPGSLLAEFEARLTIAGVSWAARATGVQATGRRASSGLLLVRAG